jgi:Uma2 family endonuclease
MRSAELEGVDPKSIRPLRRSEYDRLVAMGAFAEERLELLEGTIVAMSPQGTAHAYCVRRLTGLLVRALGDRAVVQVQGPLAASDESEPEPDVVVLEPGDYLDDHPRSAHLVIEVADTSRGKDLHVKARLYAQMSIPDYWVFDLERRELVIHRRPSGPRYEEVRALDEWNRAELLRFPDVRVQVSEILPPR